MSHFFRIDELIDKNILENTEKNNIKNGCYTLRAGKFFQQFKGSEKKEKITLEPTGIIGITTLESINLQIKNNNDKYLIGLYEQLFRLSQKGLVLFNASVVEPGYKGLLSCYLVNISDQTHIIRKEDPIAKIVFIESDISSITSHGAKNDITYENTIEDTIANFPEKIFKISNIEKYAWKALTKYSILAAIAILFITISLQTSSYIQNRLDFDDHLVTKKKMKEEIEKTKYDQDISKKFQIFEDLLKKTKSDIDITKQLKRLENYIKCLENNLDTVKKSYENIIKVKIDYDDCN